MIDIPEIEAIIGYIETHPDEWDQELWAVRGSCGTSMCIAGHACVRAGYKIQWITSAPVAEGLTNGDLIEDRARQVLGLSPAQGRMLFSGANSLEDLKQITKRFANGDLPAEIPDFGRP